MSATITPPITSAIPGLNVGRLAGESYFLSHSSDFKIVLLYEDLASGIRGSEVLKRLSEQVEAAAGALDSDVWKFELLHFQPELRDQVIFRLMGAQMIIIATSTGRDLPAHIREWLERALTLRNNRQVALVAHLDWKHSADGLMPRSGAYLRELAVKFGLEFFANQGEWQPQPVSHNAEIEGDLIMAGDWAPYETGGRDWGIND